MYVYIYIHTHLICTVLFCSSTVFVWWSTPGWRWLCHVKPSVLMDTLRKSKVAIGSRLKIEVLMGAHPSACSIELLDWIWYDIVLVGTAWHTFSPAYSKCSCPLVKKSHSCGESPSLAGKSTIKVYNLAIFNSYVVQICVLWLLQWRHVSWAPGCRVVASWKLHTSHSDKFHQIVV